MIKKIIILFSVLTTILLSTETKTITFGIVPQQAPLKMLKKWNPIISQIEQKTGYKIKFIPSTSIPEFEKKLYKGDFDFAYMNPYHFIQANKKRGYRAKVRSDKLIQGILVSKSDNIKLNETFLKGKNILFPAPNAFAATLLTKYELKKKYNIDVEVQMKQKYVKSHDSVYKGVLRDMGVIGGGIIRTYKNFQDKDKESLKIIYKTELYPSHPIAFLPSVEEEVINQITKVLLNMEEEELKKLSMKKFIQTDTKEFEVIKEVK